MAALGRLTHVILDHYRKPRVLGLDLLRIAASLSIITYHANPRVILGKDAIADVLGNDGYLAVDVFFVLSGWLLTRQVLRMRSSFTNRWKFMLRFWTRRWARTLPPYWVVLVLLFLFGQVVIPHLHRDPSAVSPLTLPRLPIHALFLQTLMPPNSLGVSWSLIAEEWFYLLLPIVVLLLAPRVRSWKVVLGLGFAVLLMPSVIRAAVLATQTWRDGVVVTPQARFEGLVVGALLAAASLGAPWWQTHVMARRRLLFGLGVVLTLIILVAGVSHSWAFNVFGLLAFNLSIGLLMPFLSQLRWRQSAPVIAVIGVAYLSELTYPLYLLHVFRPQFHDTSPAMAVLFAVLLLLAATALHLGVERPFLALRDRHDEARSRRAAGAAPTAWKEPATPAESPSPLVGEGRAGHRPVVGSVTPEAAFAPKAAG